jgi:hypothetical protein
MSAPKCSEDGSVAVKARQLEDASGPGDEIMGSSPMSLVG